MWPCALSAGELRPSPAQCAGKGALFELPTPTKRTLAQAVAHCLADARCGHLADHLGHRAGQLELLERAVAGVKPQVLGVTVAVASWGPASSRNQSSMKLCRVSAVSADKPAWSPRNPRRCLHCAPARYDAQKRNLDPPCSQ